MNALRPRLFAAGLLCGLAASACIAGRAMAQTAAPATGPRTAPTRQNADRPALAPADIAFMSGMILHHRQALLMAGWAPTHDAGPAVRALCDRIVVSQRDEIVAMARWLGDRREPLPDTTTPSGGSAAAMDGMPGMDRPTPMPGMLTGQQLAQLDAARGPAFDRLFLTFMIQHHEGALTMVHQLVGTPGAAQDGFVFQFASDVDADQSAEIDRMRRMLAVASLGR